MVTGRVISVVRNDLISVVFTWNIDNQGGKKNSRHCFECLIYLLNRN